MKILVTGGLGFIGNNLMPQLLAAGHELRVFDIAEADRALSYKISDVDFQQGDLRDGDALRLSVRGMDAVIHLAAHTRVIESVENPRLNFETNAIATFNLLEYMRELDVEYIVNASTGGAILGAATPPVHEDMPARPLAPYGASKLAAEGYCSAYMGAYGLKAVSLRFSNIYGRYSGLKGSVVPLFIRQILAGEDLKIYGDGNQTRDFLFAEDLARGIMQAFDKRVTGTYQLGTGAGTSVNTVLDGLKRLSGRGAAINIEHLPVRDAEVLHNICDISLARKTFGFAPETKLQDGLRHTWDWFTQNSAAMRGAA